MSQFLKVNDVAELFKVTSNTVKRWIKDGDLKATRINTRGDYRIAKKEVDKKIERGMTY